MVCELGLKALQARKSRTLELVREFPGTVQLPVDMFVKPARPVDERSCLPADFQLIDMHPKKDHHHHKRSRDALSSSLSSSTMSSARVGQSQ